MLQKDGFLLHLHTACTQDGIALLGKHKVGKQRYSLDLYPDRGRKKEPRGWAWRGGSGKVHLGGDIERRWAEGYTVSFSTLRLGYTLCECCCVSISWQHALRTDYDQHWLLADCWSPQHTNSKWQARWPYWAVGSTNIQDQQEQVFRRKYTELSLEQGYCVHVNNLTKCS